MEREPRADEPPEAPEPSEPEEPQTSIHEQPVPPVTESERDDTPGV